MTSVTTTTTNSNMQQLADNVKQLVGCVKNNQLGLPTAFYRPDLLPATLPRRHSLPAVNGLASNNPPPALMEAGDLKLLPSIPGPQGIDLSSDELSIARQELNYDEGYPTVDGFPFWSQMPWESNELHMLFDAYLKQASETTRQLYTLRDILDKDPMTKALADTYSMKDLQNIFIIYMWSQRSRAYDLFYAAHRRKQQEMRAFHTEDSHYLMALRLQQVVDTYLSTKGDDLLELMTPKSFIELVKLVVQLQRISSGLSANGPTGSTPAPLGASSLEVTMRSIAQQGGSEDDISLVAGSLSLGAPAQSARRDMIKAILSGDSKTLEMAQELTIKINNGGQDATIGIKQGRTDGDFYT